MTDPWGANGGVSGCITAAIDAACAAGDEILDVYRADGDTQPVTYKEDSSPLTVADSRAHEAIVSVLSGFDPGIPQLSEEGASVDAGQRAAWERLWLIDPLDGTKEFLKRNGEFTVNIALIEGGKPMLGVVYAPYLGLLYAGAVGWNAYRLRMRGGDREPEDRWSKANASQALRLLAEHGEPLPCETGERAYRIIASRSHLNEETGAYIERRRAEYPDLELVSSGSSLKLCRVAEGSADEYPRFAPTMEWDTAAADAVCRAAGCTVISWPDGEPLRYNKPDLHNRWFLVRRDGSQR